MTDFYKGKKVLVTGHTGFKGGWLCMALALLGADVTGFALEPPAGPSLFEIAGIGGLARTVTGDIRDRDRLISVFGEYRPEIVFHLAAQPLVRQGYAVPAYTFDTNVMGTVNVCEAARVTGGVRSFINVTTDKVYKSTSAQCREEDALGGADPYSCSKSCSELVTAAYDKSWFRRMGTAASTCRAGNVIGGGDFAADRIIPDCVRAAEKGAVIKVRNPGAVRPFQHVMEAVGAYLLLAEKQYGDAALAGCYNVGPEERDCVTVGALAEMFCKSWGGGAAWQEAAEPDAPPEAEALRLDCTKIKRELGWQPRWSVGTAVEKTVEWSRRCLSGGDAAALTRAQIAEYFGGL